MAYFGGGKRGKYYKLWIVQFHKNWPKNFVKKVEIFLKKDLKFPAECVIIFRLTFNATKRKVAIAPIFPGVYGEFPWSKFGLKPSENLRKSKGPYPLELRGSAA